MNSGEIVDLDEQPVAPPSSRRRRVVHSLIAAAAASGALLIGVSSMRGLGTSSSVPTQTAVATALAAGTVVPLAGPNDPPDFVGGVRSHAAELRFQPLIPATAPALGTADVAGCGVATSWCLRITWNERGATARVLEGPAGCCLDSVRGDGRHPNDVEIHPGVWAHWEDLDARFGGPILWWVDTRGPTAIYLALSSPDASRDELMRIARSLSPLGAADHVGDRAPTCGTTPHLGSCSI